MSRAGLALTAGLAVTAFGDLFGMSFLGICYVHRKPSGDGCWTGGAARNRGAGGDVPAVCSVAALCALRT